MSHCQNLDMSTDGQRDMYIVCLCEVQILTKRHVFADLPLQGFFEMSKTIQESCGKHRESPGNQILEDHS